MLQPVELPDVFHVSRDAAVSVIYERAELERGRYSGPVVLAPIDDRAKPEIRLVEEGGPMVQPGSGNGRNAVLRLEIHSPEVAVDFGDATLASFPTL